MDKVQKDDPVQWMIKQEQINHPFVRGGFGKRAGFLRIFFAPFPNIEYVLYIQYIYHSQAAHQGLSSVQRPCRAVNPPS